MTQLACSVALTAVLASGGFALAQTPAGDPPAQPGHDPEVVEMLSAAVNAARSLHTIQYDAKIEVRSGEKQRIVSGSVTLQRFNYTDPLGGLMAVSGKIYRTDNMQVKTFKLAYDGGTVRRYIEGSGVVLEADAGYGGETLALGNFGSLVVRNLVASEPYATERMVRATSYVGQQELEDTTADVIELRFDDQRLMRWFFDTETHLPVRREQRLLSSRGEPVQTVLQLSNVVIDPEISETAFDLPTPEGARTERMGKEPPRPFGIGDDAPAWELIDGNGRAHRLEDYKGQLVVLDFWSTWCPHCNNAMPALQRLHEEYADKGVAILGLNCRERGDIDATQYLRDRGFTYPVLDGNTAAIRYRVRGIPAFYVISPDGKLLYRSSGYGPQEETRLAELIKEHAPG